MPLENLEEVLKDLESQKKPDDNDLFAAEAPTNQNVQAEEPQDEEPVDESSDDEEEHQEEEDEEELALSDDARKRAKAFGKSREAQRELREQLEQERKERQALAERLAKMEGRTEALTKPEAKDETDHEPDKDLYPEDHMAWKIRQLEKRTEQAERLAKVAEQNMTYQNELRGVSMLESQYKSSNPKEDYDGAMKFLAEKERAAKKIVNPKLTDSQVDAMIEQEKVGIFKQLYASGRNPAEVLMQLAKAHGYDGKVQSAPRRDLARVEENQRRNTNIIGGSPSGKSPNGKVSSDDIMGMTFAKALRMANNNPTKFDRYEE